MARNSEHIILDVKTEAPFMNLLEKQSGGVIKETDEAYHTMSSGNSVIEERSSAELLSIYLKSLGCYRRRKRHRYLSRELDRMLISQVAS
jgi:hypothetical protein